MRKIIVLLILCLPVLATAQKRNLEPENISPKAPLYILNGKETTDDVTKTVVPDSILRIDVLKDVSAKSMYGIKGINGVVLVTTRDYAVSQYQQLLGSFSNELQSWLSTQGNKDAQLAYYIDGIEVPKTDAGRNKLFDLKKDKIASVTLTKNQPTGSKYAANVKIVTKK